MAGNWIAVSLTWGNRVVARNSLYQLSGEYQLCFDQLYKEWVQTAPAILLAQTPEDLLRLEDTDLLLNNVILRKRDSQEIFSVSLSDRVEVMQLFDCNHVTFTFEAAAPRTGVRPRVFDEMMRGASSELHLPEPVSSLQRSLNQKEELHNEIISYLHNNGLGWRQDLVSTTGANIVKQLCHILWLLSPYHSELHQRGSNEHRSILQDCELLRNSKNAHDFFAQGKKRPAFPRKEVEEWVAKGLWSLLDKPFFKKSAWSQLFDQLIRLARLLDSVIEWMQQQNIRMQVVHNNVNALHVLGMSYAIYYYAIYYYSPTVCLFYPCLVSLIVQICRC